MMLTKDEERLIDNYRHVREQCELFQSSEFQCPATGFPVKGGCYFVCLKGEYVGEEKE